MRGVYITILLLMSLFLVVSVSASTCQDYCRGDTYFSRGSYDARAEQCDYIYQTTCRYGCDGDRCATAPPEPEPRESTRTETRPVTRIVEPLDFTDVSIQPDIPIETVSVTTQPEIEQFETEPGPGCKIDSDGKDYFKPGKVGYFEKQETEKFKMDDKGMPVAVASTYKTIFTAKDICYGKTLKEYSCDVASNKCVSPIGILGLNQMIASDGNMFNKMDIDEFTAYSCVVNPQPTIEGGKVVYEDYECVCGCNENYCLPEDDYEKDGIADCVDPDDDNDNVLDGDDNCIRTANADQKDSDGDKLGDACDPCPNDPNNDIDKDGVCGDVDNCIDISNPTQLDFDSDGIGNECDCNDTIKAGAETGIDCGGSCKLQNCCNNTFKDVEEDDVDCGGPSCITCDLCNIPMLPAQFDWRDWKGKNWLSPAKNQGACGSCWSFSAAGTMEAKYNIEKKAIINLDLSEQSLVSSCCGAGSCYGGFRSKAFAYIKKNGILPETCYPYMSGGCLFQNTTEKKKGGKKKNITESFCLTACKDGKDRCSFPKTCGSSCPSSIKSWYLTKYAKVPSNNINAIKRALVCKGPLSVASKNWWHVVVLTGWDDTTGNWTIKNSWGTGWGDNGFGKIPYTGGNFSDIRNNVYYVEGVS